MEYVLAFLIIFLPSDLGDAGEVPTFPLALAVCQKVYPLGMVRLSKPLSIGNPATGKSVLSAFVWMCMRPVYEPIKKNG